jgi:hypothetical protein
MGRLRPEQRGNDSWIIQIVTKDCTNKNSFYNTSIRRTQEDLFRQFLNNGLLRDTDDTAFKKWFHIDAYITFLVSKGCFLRNLSMMLYGKDIACCNRCHHCTFNPFSTDATTISYGVNTVTPYKSSVATTSLSTNSNSPVRIKTKRHIFHYDNPYLPSKKAMTSSNVDTVQQNTVDKKYQSLLQSLQQRCFYCKQSTCDGFKCVPYNRCSECLSTQHKVAFCTYQSRTTQRKQLNDWLIQRQVCIYCLVPYNESNHNRPCPWSSRIKRMVVSTNTHLSLKERVQKVHASEASFKTWLSGH